MRQNPVTATFGAFSRISTQLRKGRVYFLASSTSAAIIFVDCDDAFLLEDEFDALAQFFASGWSEESGDSGTYGGTENECH